MKKVFEAVFLVLLAVNFFGCVSSNQPPTSSRTIRADLCKNIFPGAKIEVIRPSGEGVYPALVFFPGRAQAAFNGTPSEVLNDAVSKGYVAIDVEYIMPTDPLETPKTGSYVGNPLMYAAQARCAIRHIKSKFEAYGVDEERIGVIAHSQGTLLAMNLALMSDNLWNAQLDAVNTQIGKMKDMNFQYSSEYTNVYSAEETYSAYSSSVNGVVWIAGGDDALHVLTQSAFVHPIVGQVLTDISSFAPSEPWAEGRELDPGVSSMLHVDSAWRWIGIPLTQVDDAGKPLKNSESGKLLINEYAVNLLNLVSPIQGVASTDYRPPVLIQHAEEDPQAVVHAARVSGRALKAADRVVKSVIFSGGVHNLHLHQDDDDTAPTVREIYYGFFQTIFSPAFKSNPTSVGFEEAFSEKRIAGFTNSADFFCASSSAPLNSARSCDVQ